MKKWRGLKYGWGAMILKKTDGSQLVIPKQENVLAYSYRKVADAWRLIVSLREGFQQEAELEDGELEAFQKFMGE
jgi:hypothetical protein